MHGYEFAFGWPQGILVSIWVLIILADLAKNNGEKLGVGLFGLVGVAGLLYWGGFFTRAILP